MDEQERLERAKVVEEAKTWLGTPYHHMGRVKGQGVDCAMLIAEVYERAGMIPHRDIPFYPMQWNLNRNAESYLQVILDHAKEFDGPPLPGDVVVWKFGRTFAHGGIVIDWPIIIHAYVRKNCMTEDVDKAVWLKFIGERGSENYGKLRPVRFFSYWLK